MSGERTKAERKADEASAEVRRLEAKNPIPLGALRHAIKLREKAWREVNRLRGVG